MQVFLTYDYELFFGDPTGTAQKCILEPTDILRNIAKRTGVKMVFFIDCGYLKKLEEFKNRFESVAEEYEKIVAQIKLLVQEGHDCQLHIHPHWEDSFHDGKKWVMNTNRYKLSDFSDDEIERIFVDYQAVLFAITEKSVNSFRAGGWCLQPFERVRHAFEKANIKLDSTVFPGGKFVAGNYFYDFTKHPNKSKWNFDEDLCIEKTNGLFVEYPIASYQYSPFFFWKLFFWGRWNPVDHKPMGDGYPMASPGLRREMLTRGKLLSASADGFFVTKLEAILKNKLTAGHNEMVVLGHPKALTRFAAKRLEQFIEKNKTNHQFKTFADLNLGQ